MTPQPEYWLRGSVPDIPPTLQPVAHSLLQTLDEVEAAVAEFPSELLWTRPAGVASVGFHLQHLRGVLDRLTTYARGDALSPEQFAALSGEGAPPKPDISAAELVADFRAAVNAALRQLRETDESAVLDGREVGRARRPSTVLGLLFHAAEHTQRHLGQLLVTARVQRADPQTAQE